MRNLLLLSLMLSLTSAPIFAQETEEEEEESEFAEPIFFDTSTDIGGDAKELEINYVPVFSSINGVNALSSGFEFEYVVVKNFGIEFEPGFTSIFDSSGVQTGLNDFEIEMQYTFRATDKFGFAGGLEFGLPVGNRNLGLSERTFEIEPFLTTVHKTDFGLSFQPRVSMGIGVFELDDNEEAGEEETEFEVIGSLAVLYTIDNWFFGTELSGIYEDEWVTILTPQFGVNIGPLFLGAGFQYFHYEESRNYGGIARVIYELEFGD